MSGQDSSNVFSRPIGKTGDTSTNGTYEDPKDLIGQDKIPNPSANILNNRNHLPVVFLSNIQSFGKSDKTDKTAELELVLKLNKVQVGVFTETWLDNITCQHLDIDNYVMFHSIRNKALKASGGVSIL